MIRLALISNHPSLEEIYTSVFAAIESEKVVIDRLDRLSTDIPFLQNVWSILMTSDIIVFDIQQENDNIIYEIGLAHGLGKPVIIISSTELRMPADLLGQLSLKYELTSDSLRNLSFSIQKIIEEVFEKRRNILGLRGPREAFANPSTAISNTSTEKIATEFRYVLSFDPVRRYQVFEDWFYELAQGIDGWEVTRPLRGDRDGGYDFIVWNTLSDTDFAVLGNPIPIELKLSRLNSNQTHDIVHRTKKQGMKGLILVCSSRLQSSRKSLIRQFEKENLVLAILDSDDLFDIQSSSGLVERLKYRLRESVYGSR
jgi:hypothetical protein